MPDNATDQLSILKRFVSVETVLSVVVMLTGLGVTWGSLSTRIDQVEARVVELGAIAKELDSRDITPGAREQVAALSRTDAALQAQISELREEMRLQRREILDTLQRLETRLEMNSKR